MINQITLEERVIAEANNVTFDEFMVGTQVNESEYLIYKVTNSTINIVNEKYLINKVENMTINNVGKNLNQANVSELKIKFADNLSRKTHQHLLSIQMIGIRRD